MTVCPVLTQCAIFLGFDNVLTKHLCFYNKLWLCPYTMCYFSRIWLCWHNVLFYKVLTMCSVLTQYFTRILPCADTKFVLTVCCLLQDLSPALPPLILWVAWPACRHWVIITLPRCPQGSPLTDSGVPPQRRAWTPSVKRTRGSSNTQVCPVYSLPQEKVGGSFCFRSVAAVLFSSCFDDSLLRGTELSHPYNDGTFRSYRYITKSVTKPLHHQM